MYSSEAVEALATIAGNAPIRRAAVVQAAVAEADEVAAVASARLNCRWPWTALLGQAPQEAPMRMLPPPQLVARRLKVAHEERRCRG